MVDFADMAARAKAAHAQRLDQEANAQSQRDKARKQAVDAGIAVLNEYVRPLLVRALSEFKSQGIEAEIEEKFDVLNYMDLISPKIVFRLLGPKRRSDGHRFRTKPVGFGAISGKIEIYIAVSDYDNLPVRPKMVTEVAESEQFIAQAIEKSLDSYFEQLRTFPFDI